MKIQLLELHKVEVERLKPLQQQQQQQNQPYLGNQINGGSKDGGHLIGGVNGRSKDGDRRGKEVGISQHTNGKVLNLPQIRFLRKRLEIGTTVVT